ncbi:MAG: 5-formyltetrahydrofolate cyclo-ligase [Candidatus Micrarchaeota archaeon]
MGKKELRKKMHEARSLSHAGGGHDKIQIQMLARIRSLPGWKEARVVLSYASVRTEVSTELINREIMREKKTLCLPMTRQEEGVMEAGGARDLDGLVKSAFGTLEPDPKDAEVIEAGKIDFVLVPGLAFDKKGRRLGYGMGYYDKFLKKVRADCAKVGLAYEGQMLKEIVPEAHDVPMDYVVTEKRALKI